MLSRVSSRASLLLFMLNELRRNPLCQSRHRKGYAISNVNIIMLIQNIFDLGAVVGKTNHLQKNNSSNFRCVHGNYYYIKLMQSAWTTHNNRLFCAAALLIINARRIAIRIMHDFHLLNCGVELGIVSRVNCITLMNTFVCMCATN